MSDTPVGSRWLETTTNRTVVILNEEVHGTGPAFRYEDTPGSWHYCFADDFVSTGRFKLLGDVQ